MTSTPPPLTGRTIGETENALRAVLLRALTGTDLDYHRWVTLKLVSEAQPAISESAALDQLEAGLRINRASARQVIDHLRSEGIVIRVEDSLTTTVEGAAVYRRLNGEIRLLAQEMWEGLEPADLATAQRVLSTIRDRAHLLLAS